MTLSAVHPLPDSQAQEDVNGKTYGPLVFRSSVLSEHLPKGKLSVVRGASEEKEWRWPLDRKLGKGNVCLRRKGARRGQNPPRTRTATSEGACCTTLRKTPDEDSR